MVRCTFSLARAWRLTVGPASTRTLGVNNTMLHPSHLLLTITVLLCTSASAQLLWQGANAGMSVDQVRSAVPDAKPTANSRQTILDGSVELLRIEEVPINDQNFVASFYLHQSGLRQVSLSLTNQPWSALENSFQNLLVLLRSKHGPETRHDQIVGGERKTLEARWNTSGTTVSMTAWHFKHANSDLFIAYRPQYC